MSDEKDNIGLAQNGKEDPIIIEEEASLSNKTIGFWIKNHGSVTALFTAIIAIIAFVINTLYYLFNLVYTKYWGTTVPHDKLLSGTGVYTFIIIVFGVAGVILLFTYLGSAIDSQIKIGFLLKERLDNKKRPKNKKEKMNKEERKTLKFIKMRTENRLRLFGRSILVIITMTILMLFFTLAFFSSGLLMSHVLLVTIVSALLFFVGSFLHYWWMYRIKYKDTHKNNKRDESRQIDTLISEENNRFRISNYLSKINFETVITSVISFSFVMLIIFIISIILLPSKTNKRFNTYYDIETKKEYVLIYQSDDYYYFDEAEFQTDGDDFVTLKVYINKNRIIKTDDIELITKTFNIVEKSLSTEETVPQGTQEPIEDTDIQGTQEPIEDTDIQGTQEP